jgi:hypothetical protein
VPLVEIAYPDQFDSFSAWPVLLHGDSRLTWSTIRFPLLFIMGVTTQVSSLWQQDCCRIQSTESAAASAEKLHSEAVKNLFITIRIFAR